MLRSDHLVLWVVRYENGTASFETKLLDRERAVGQGCNEVTWLRLAVAFDDGSVSIQHAGLNHGVAPDRHKARLRRTSHQHAVETMWLYATG